MELRCCKCDRKLGYNDALDGGLDLVDYYCSRCWSNDGAGGFDNEPEYAVHITGCPTGAEPQEPDKILHPMFEEMYSKLVCKKKMKKELCMSREPCIKIFDGDYYYCQDLVSKDTLSKGQGLDKPKCVGCGKHYSEMKIVATGKVMCYKCILESEQKKEQEEGD